MSEGIALDVIDDEIHKLAEQQEKAARKLCVIGIKRAIASYKGSNHGVDQEWAELAVGVMANEISFFWFNDNHFKDKSVQDWVTTLRNSVPQKRRMQIVERITKEMMGNLLKRR